jgi:hypothetical protein
MPPFFWRVIFNTHPPIHRFGWAMSVFFLTNHELTGLTGKRPFLKLSTLSFSAFSPVVLGRFVDVMDPMD